MRNAGMVDVHACDLTDIPSRLSDMDHLGMETQVVYPRLFLIYVTDDAPLAIALCRAYNRCLAQAEDVPARVVEKILTENPRRLYGLA
jgi:hypothetical protein